MKAIKQYLGLAQPTTTDAANGSTSDFPTSSGVDRQARYLAEQICSGFQLHDRRQRAESVEAFYAVDRNQFAHLSNDEALRASTAYVDALWAKDDIEKSHQADGRVDPVGIADADYGEVLDALVRRTEIVGMDVAYAEKTTEAWKKHKTEDDYWTPFFEAQAAELRVALQNPHYPGKPKEGGSGYGALATRYVLAVELHDMHSLETWEEAIRVMTPYYRTILETHRKNGLR